MLLEMYTYAIIDKGRFEDGTTQRYVWTIMSLGL